VVLAIFDELISIVIVFSSENNRWHTEGFSEKSELFGDPLVKIYYVETDF